MKHLAICFSLLGLIPPTSLLSERIACQEAIRSLANYGRFAARYTSVSNGRVGWLTHSSERALPQLGYFRYSWGGLPMASSLGTASSMDAGLYTAHAGYESLFPGITTRSGILDAAIRAIRLQGTDLVYLLEINPVVTILNTHQLQLTLNRLAHQLVEDHESLDELVFIGLQPRGIQVGEYLMNVIRNLRPDEPVKYGVLDITFYRDDLHRGIHLANQTELPFSVDGKRVVLIDDVLYTGRTIRAALDALQDFGRPAQVSLCVLVDRRFNRELPIQPDYCGKQVDTILSQKIKVDWQRREVVLYS